MRRPTLEASRAVIENLNLDCYQMFEFSFGGPKLNKFLTELKIDENLKIPPEKFKVPAGIKIVESRVIEDNQNK